MRARRQRTVLPLVASLGRQHVRPRLTRELRHDRCAHSARHPPSPAVGLADERVDRDDDQRSVASRVDATRRFRLGKCTATAEAIRTTALIVIVEFASTCRFAQLASGESFDKARGPLNGATCYRRLFFSRQISQQRSP
jgi:hypothetical protein